MKEAKLQKEVKTLIIKGSGKTKEEALGKVFALFRKKVQDETDGVIVKLEPLETYLINIKEEKKIEKFLELFMPREKLLILLKWKLSMKSSI